MNDMFKIPTNVNRCLYQEKLSFAFLKNLLMLHQAIVFTLFDYLPDFLLLPDPDETDPTVRDR